MKNEQEAGIMLARYRRQGIVAFSEMCKAAGKKDVVAANREYFAMGYATAKTEAWKNEQIHSWLHRLRVKTARFFVRVFTGHGPKVVALFLLTAATHERPECPKSIVSNILACDVNGCLVLKVDGTQGKAKLPVELGAIIPICPVKNLNLSPGE